MKDKIISAILIFILMLTTFCSLCYAEEDTTNNINSEEPLICTGKFTQTINIEDDQNIEENENTNESENEDKTEAEAKEKIENEDQDKIQTQDIKSKYFNLTAATPVPSDDTNEDTWTQFGDSEYQLKKESNSNVVTFTIPTTNYTRSHGYYVVLTKEPIVSDISSLSEDDMITLIYRDSKQQYEVTDSAFTSQYEKNVSYINIIEEIRTSSPKQKQVVATAELERLPEPKYYDAFKTTFLSDDALQIVSYVSHSNNKRKAQIKVGKLTDMSVIQTLQNSSDLTGWDMLMDFARNDSSSLYNDTMDCERSDTTPLSFTKNTGIININQIEENQYYYLYLKTDDENGTYISTDMVSLGIPKINNKHDQFFLGMYGSDDFGWIDYGDTGGGVNDQPVTIARTYDNSLSTLTLPKAGTTIAIVIAITVLATTGVVAYMKIKKYKDIK